MATIYYAAYPDTPGVKAMETIHANPGPEFSLEELRRYVGGDIEAMRMDNGLILYLNEDGKRLGLPLNRVATMYAKANNRRYRFTDDVIVGDALLCDGTETS